MVATTTIDRTRSEEFLGAFIEIEMHLRRVLRQRPEVSFTALIDMAARSSPIVRRFESDLKQYGDLRNAIVHVRRDNQPIAEPHPDTVEHLKRIAAMIMEPPQVSELGTIEVIRCSPHDPIGEVARSMRENFFSQVPVYDGREFVGLLTTDAITWWMGAQLEFHDGLLEDRPVSEVLPYRDASSTEAFVCRTTEIAAIIERFESTMRAGKKLEAVIVTQNGQRNESPLQIVTVYDLPQLYRMVSGESVS